MEEKPYKPRFGRPPKVPSSIPAAADNGLGSTLLHGTTSLTPTVTSASVKQEASSPATSGTAPVNNSTTSNQGQLTTAAPTAPPLPTYKGPKWKWKQQQQQQHQQSSAIQKQQAEEHEARQEADQGTLAREQEQQQQQSADVRREPSLLQARQPAEAVVQAPRKECQEPETHTSQPAAAASTTAGMSQPVAAAVGAAATGSTEAAGAAHKAGAAAAAAAAAATTTPTQAAQLQQEPPGQHAPQQQVVIDDKDRPKDGARKDRDAKDKAAHTGKEEAKKPRQGHAAGGAQRTTTPALARRATANLDDVADVEEEEDMFVTLPSVAIKQQQEDKSHSLARKGSVKAGMGAAHRSSAGGAADCHEQGSKANRAAQGGGKAPEAGEQAKPTKTSKRAREDTPRDTTAGPIPEEGAGEAAAKKSRATDAKREVSEPSSSSVPKLQAHNSLTGSTGKVDALAAVHAASTTAAVPADVRDRKEAASSRQDRQTGSKRSTDAAARQQQGASRPAKKQRADQSAAKDKASNDDVTRGGKVVGTSDAGSSPVGERPALKRGPSIVVVKPLDNSAQDPATRKPPVVQSGEPMVLPVHPLPVAPAPAAPATAPTAGKAQLGSAGKAGARDVQQAPVKDTGTSGMKREGSTAVAAAAAAAATAEAGSGSKPVTDVGKIMEEVRQDTSGAASPAAAERAKQSEKGATGAGKQRGEKRDKGDKACMRNEKAAGGVGMVKDSKGKDAAPKPKVKQEQEEETAPKAPARVQPLSAAPASSPAAAPASVTHTQGAVVARTESGIKQEEHMVDCILECGQSSCATGVAGLTLPPSIAALLCQALGRATGGAVESGSVQSVMKAKVNLSKTRSAKELWAQLSHVFKPDVLPDQLQAQLVYMDGDGDWMLVMPDEPWVTVAKSARKLLIAHKA